MTTSYSCIFFPPSPIGPAKHLPLPFKADQFGGFNVQIQGSTLPHIKESTIPPSPQTIQAYFLIWVIILTSPLKDQRILASLIVSETMVVGQLHYFIAMEKATESTSTSPSPLFGLVDVFLYGTVFYKIPNLLSKFWFFLLSHLSSGNSKGREGKQISDCELRNQESSFHGSRDDGKLARDEAKKVMAKLGFFCSPESEELQERYGSDELSGLFDDQEPSLEEVKQAFDVFDENRDGFIDARELQRVLCILGLKEAAELENCRKMITNFDENGDGRIDFNEFVKITENNLS